MQFPYDHTMSKLNRTWNVRRTPLPQGQNLSAYGQVTLETSMGAMSIKTPWTDRARAWLWENRRWCGPLAGFVVSSACVLTAGTGRASLCTALVSANIVATTLTLLAKESLVPSEEHEALVAEVAQVEHMVKVGERAIKPVTDQAVSRVVREWVEKLKLRFGGLQDTPADRRVAKMWLADEMRQNDMRTKDAVRLIPIVVELALLPNQGDIIAKNLRGTRTAELLRSVCPLEKI